MWVLYFNNSSYTIDASSSMAIGVSAFIMPSSAPICPWVFLSPTVKPAAPQQKSFDEVFKSPLVDIHKPSIPDPIV